MSRFHQLSAGKSGSGAGNAPPTVAFIPKAEPPDNVSSNAVSPPSQFENCATVFICELLRDLYITPKVLQREGTRPTTSCRLGPLTRRLGFYVVATPTQLKPTPP